MEINNIGKLIRNERILLGLTQLELGARVGFTKSQVSKIENGKITTLKPINRLIEALGMDVKIQLNKKSIINKKLSNYIVVCINDFAKAFDLSIKEASNYLMKFKGLDFIMANYEIEHLLSIDDSVQDLAQVCRNNGGKII